MGQSIVEPVGDTVKKLGQALDIAGDFCTSLAADGKFAWHGGKTWDLFQFNYDSAAQRAVVQNDVLYAKTAAMESNGGSVKESARVTCVNCYATLEAGVSVDIVLKPQVSETATKLASNLVTLLSFPDCQNCGHRLGSKNS